MVKPADRRFAVGAIIARYKANVAEPTCESDERNEERHIERCHSPPGHNALIGCSS
jgi:hypothetical protein